MCCFVRWNVRTTKIALTRQSKLPGFCKSSNAVVQLFHEAIHVVFNKPKVTTKPLVTKKPLFLHLTYNPINPKKHQLQTCFKTSIVSPPDLNHISEEPTENPFNSYPDFDRCIICYSGQRTIGNILAPRKHRFGPNFHVADYLQELQNG